MAKEIHYYIFSREEVFGALIRFRATRSNKVATHSISTVRFTEGVAGVEATLAGSGNKSDPEFSFVYGPSDLLAAILLHCKSQRIPMAVRADKRIEVVGDQIALIATLNLSRPRLVVEANTIRLTADNIQ